MARRGDALREHILVVAKDVFLESGFDRASMDVVAARAETSKRSLYAHFESKDKLFAAVVTLAREMYLDKLKTPADYDGDVTLYCARFLQLLLREPALRTCRMGIAEAERLPEASAGYYDAIFATSHDRLTTFLVENRALTPESAGETATELLGLTVHPRLFRALLGVEKPLPVTADLTTLTTDIDLTPIRAAVDRALG
ncbi:TetR/AcrR family transcriptional regulator [Umezawaea sp. NPDC059074]|uniref:TetR/AcrR family transcriptional regulator n=1 Tax=Umezawaea sp. NPDC059074 TaxID=3346716 RepID=UPI00367C7C0C